MTADPRGTGQLDVAGAAPTATTTPPAPSRARGRIRVLVAVAVVCAIAAGAYVVLREPEHSDELRPEVEEVMKRLTPAAAPALYAEDTSEQFRQTMLEQKLVDLVDRMNRTLGAFVEVSAITDVDKAASVAGMTARVEFEVSFEKADTTATMSFLRTERDTTWKLLGFGVDIPPELEKAARELEGEEERVRAPAEVIEKVEQTLAALRDGKVAEVREQASPVFQENQTVESFTALLESHRAELGDYIAVLATISSAQNADKDRATVQSLIQYSKAKTTGLFQFERAAGVWRLYTYKIVIPRPQLPPPSP